MRILAFDSTATAASVAVCDDGRVLTEFIVNAGLTHSRTLVPMLDAALKNTDSKLKSIDALAVSNGPGSFTGVRIGVAVAKGIAFAENLPCYEISTLEAMAYNLVLTDCLVCSVMDARCNQVYNGLFEIKYGEVIRLCDDRAIAIADLKAELTEKIAGRGEFTLAEENGALLLTAKGMAKHACEPDGSVNAAKLIAELLSSMESLNAADRQIMTDINKTLGCHYGSTMGLEHDDIRFGKLTFVNGMVKMCGGKICLSFDTRYGSTLEPAEFEEIAEKAFADMGWEMEIDSNMKGFSIADDSPIPDKLVEIYNTVTGFETSAIRLGGGTYARKIENAFSVGTKTLRKDRKTPVMEMPAGHGGAHQSDEMIDIEAFFDAVRIITHYIINIDECL